MKTRTSPKRVLQNGFAIRELRQREGITLSELAQAINISDPHLRNLELEHRSARPEIAARIAKKLRVPPAAILRDSDSALEEIAG